MTETTPAQTASDRPHFDDARALGTVSSVCISLAAVGTTFVSVTTIKLDLLDQFVLRFAVFALILCSGLAMDAILDLIPEPHWQWLGRSINNAKARSFFYANIENNVWIGFWRRLYVYSSSYAIFSFIHSVMIFWTLYDALAKITTYANLTKAEAQVAASVSIVTLSLLTGFMLFAKMMTYQIEWKTWKMAFGGYVMLACFAAILVWKINAT